MRSPRFTGSGWLAFPALRAAYKHVQLELEFRPEAWDGVLLLAGERDDLQGDFMALILHHGFIEFRYLHYLNYQFNDSNLEFVRYKKRFNFLSQY